jgi:hypothetical protein
MKKEIELENHLDRLKRQIEFKAGFKVIAFHNCKVLSKRLKQEKIAVSPLTLARIFKLSVGTKKPYTSTLDLLSNYIGYSSFSNFIHESENFSRNWLFGSPFETNNFSIHALELAIQQSDWKMVKNLLEKSNPDKDDYEFPMFLGNAVRNHPNRQEFLAALMDVEVGRVYFYDRFVDEDDPDGYFSDSLDQFSVNFNKKRGGQIFKTCFQVSKKIYSGKEINLSAIGLLNSKDWDHSELHFHQISRWYEVQILLAVKNRRPFSDIETLLSELMDLLPKYAYPDQCWLIARPLKALLHSNLLDKVMKNRDFNETILGIHLSMGDKVKSIGELIVQLVSHTYCNSENILGVPRAISSTHFNETHSRIAIESATVLLYAQQPIKGMVLKNLKPFALRTGNDWVLNIFDKKK